MEKYEFKSFVTMREAVEIITCMDKADSFESAVVTLHIPNKKGLTKKECEGMQEMVKAMFHKISTKLDEYLTTSSNDNVDDGNNTNE